MVDQLTRRCIFVSCLLSLLFACDAGTENTTQINTDSITEIALPEILRTVSSLDLSDLQLQVTVNDTETVLTRDEDDMWHGSVGVPANQLSTVAVEWSFDYGTFGFITLAEQTTDVFVRSSESTVTFAGNYDVDFDRDLDGRNNLDELRQNRSPVNRLDVFVNSDGTFDTNGVVYPFSDVCGSQIPIDTLTFGEVTEFSAWWCATLEQELTDVDGNVQQIQNLRVTVNVNDEQLFTDSGTEAGNVSFQDDSIEIFIDGDNNKRGRYDGVNDFQFRFGPLGDGVFETALGPAGFSSLNLNGTFEYFTGGYILTATIPLNDVGIRNNREFGITVEVNDDDDGGDRDGKYAWVFETEGRDVSFFNTEAFGSSQIP